MTFVMPDDWLQRTAEGWTQTFYAASMDFGGGVPGSQPQKIGAPDIHPDTHGH